MYNIRKQKEKLLHFFADSESKKEMELRKTMKDGRSSDLDRVPITWFKPRINESVQVSGDMVK
ncbi:hypothetical protein M514_02469 [Trichuris suis]|uniref:Uncharacterized protein n=1 Tax=Trichuris suis TaxID=68888 RepID=A0A085MHU6_9BILA|nr:hypothetical protein M513_02469 [Trichuris suis]KFD68138.1 hypothetical protein M514_02469 [Trichuris suis]